MMKISDLQYNHQQHEKRLKRILEDNNSLNISVINKDDQNKTINVETHCHKPILSVVKENVEYGRIAELFL